MITRLTVSLALASLAALGAARADEPLPALPTTAAGGTVEVRLDHTRRDGDARAWTADVRWQYLGARGLGGFVALPLVLGSTVDAAEPERTVGNVTLGALYTRPLGRTVAGFAEAGLALGPWASRRGLALDALIVPQPTRAVVADDGTWLRAAGGVRSTGAGLQYGAVVGLEVMIAGDAVDAPALLASMAAALGYSRSGVTASVGATFLRSYASTNLGLGDDLALGATATVAVDLGHGVTAVASSGLNPHEAVAGTSIGTGVRARF